MSLYDESVANMKKTANDVFNKSNYNYTSMNNLAKLNSFWMKSKWYLVGLLFFLVLIIYYNKQKMGTINMAAIILIVFLFIIVIIAFNDNKGVMGNAVPFAVNPLPPHLGLDGVSNKIRFVN